MSPTDIHIIQAAAAHRVRVSPRGQSTRLRTSP